MDETSENNVNIKLGDIIEIEALDDMLFHNIKFFVKYIDKKKIVLISEEKDEQTLLINEEGGLRNENISAINILHREKDKGYAKQNGLTVSTWIDIHFKHECSDDYYRTNHKFRRGQNRNYIDQ